MSPHGSQAEDLFTPSVGAWHYQHEGHILLGLFCLSIAPAWERLTSCACMIMHTWNHITAGQKLSKPHLAFVDTSHRQISVESSENLLMVCCNRRKWISQLARGSTQMPGEMLAVMHACLPASHLGGLLMKVPGWRLNQHGWFNFNPLAQLKWHNGNQKLA